MTLANAPRVGKDARLCARDLPDGTSEIFLQMYLDRIFRTPPDGQITLIGLDNFRAGGDQASKTDSATP